MASTKLLNLIKKSYGTEDDVFAGHAYDQERAREALVLANEEGIGLQEFLDLHKEYLKNKNKSENHINKQLLRIQDIKMYFNYD